MNGSERLPRHGARLLVLLLLTLVTGVGLAGPAAAHNVLTGSDPADGAVLQSAPTVVSLTFDQPVQDFEPVVAVIGPDGQRYESGSPQVDSTVVTNAVGPMTVAGGYTIAYRVVSADGHPVQGEVRFELAVPPSGSTTAVVPTSDAASGAPGSADSSGGASSAGAAGTAGSAAAGSADAAGSVAASSPAAVAASSSAPATSASAAPVTPTSGSSGLSGWVWAAIVVAAVLVVTAIVVIVRRPKQSAPPE